MASTRPAVDSQRSHSEQDYKELLAELSLVQGKLSGKVEALLMVSQELGQAQTQRDRWQHKAESCSSKVEQLDGLLRQREAALAETSATFERERAALLRSTEALRAERTDLQDALAASRQDLKEARGDAKVLRQKLGRLELGSALDDMGSAPVSRGPSASVDAGAETLRSLSLASGDLFDEEREAPLDPVLEMEKLREQLAQMETDLRGVLCEKEELVGEREEYKTKVERLSQEISFILNGHESRVVSDLDGLISENRYLKSQLANAQEETGLTQAALNKYRNLMDKRSLSRSGSNDTMSLGRGPGGGGLGGGGGGVRTVVTPKQVRDLLGDRSTSSDDYRSLATALFDAVKDKSLALSHQRKTNKILGLRVRELEERVRAVESRSPNRLHPAGPDAPGPQGPPPQGPPPSPPPSEPAQ